jgi:hypothetical protein
MGHLEHVTVEALPLPTTFGELPCLGFRATEREVLSRFGEPHARFNGEEIFAEPGPCVYWALRYSCGLDLVVTYYLHADWVKVSANEFDDEHILEHLAMPTPDLWQMDAAGAGSWRPESL